MGVREEDAKIDGAVQIAIGVKKEVDFSAWYQNINSSIVSDDMDDLGRFCSKQICWSTIVSADATSPGPGRSASGRRYREVHPSAFLGCMLTATPPRRLVQQVNQGDECAKRVVPHVHLVEGARR